MTESIIYPRGIGEKWSRTAVFIQFRHGPQEPAELVSNNGQRDQLYIMVNHRYPTGQMDMEALETCFRKAHLSVLEDDGVGVKLWVLVNSPQGIKIFRVAG